jgi:hypothetical protein
MTLYKNTIFIVFECLQMDSLYLRHCQTENQVLRVAWPLMSYFAHHIHGVHPCARRRDNSVSTGVSSYVKLHTFFFC